MNTKQVWKSILRYVLLVSVMFLLSFYLYEIAGSMSALSRLVKEISEGYYNRLGAPEALICYYILDLFCCVLFILSGFFFVRWRLFCAKKKFAVIGSACLVGYVLLGFFAMIVLYSHMGGSSAIENLQYVLKSLIDMLEMYFFSNFYNLSCLLIGIAVFVFALLSPKGKKYACIPFFVWTVAVLVSFLMRAKLYFQEFQVYYIELIYYFLLILFTVSMGAHILTDAGLLRKKDSEAVYDSTQIASRINFYLNNLQKRYEYGELTEEEYRMQRMELLKGIME